MGQCRRDYSQPRSQVGFGQTAGRVFTSRFPTHIPRLPITTWPDPRPSPTVTGVYRAPVEAHIELQLRQPLSPGPTTAQPNNPAASEHHIHTLLQDIPGSPRRPLSEPTPPLQPPLAVRPAVRAALSGPGGGGYCGRRRAPLRRPCCGSPDMEPLQRLLSSSSRSRSL